ncbi:terminase small subunit [Listeria booriae]|uniref:terminase small subunit n=1 Tax=Listeria booriae TaxID=1552123 RepID=UPI00162332ED|nr:terminase small subunit [Listeria booriae]MBC2163429.1 terminase small subunit [Listeria booriae]
MVDVVTKTEQKYKVFAQAYVSNGFNATEAAKQAGYSGKTAHVRASVLLKNVKVLEFIDIEINELAKRMRNDANKVYKMLWDRIYDCGVKMAKSDEAKKGLVPLNSELASLFLKDIPLAEHVDDLKDELEDMAFQTGVEAMTRRAEIDQELSEYNGSRRALKAKMKYVDSLKNNFYLDFLSNIEYEKYARLQTDLLQDLFDRCGYKDASNINNSLLDSKLEYTQAQISKIRAEINQISGNDVNDSKDAIKEFIAATNPSDDDIAALYEGEEDG